MAKYTLGDKEVTEEEFYKAVKTAPFFLDEVIVSNSFPRKIKIAVPDETKRTIEELKTNLKPKLSEEDRAKIDALKQHLKNSDQKFNSIEDITKILLPREAKVSNSGRSIAYGYNNTDTGGTVFEKVQNHSLVGVDINFCNKDLTLDKESNKKYFEELNSKISTPDPLDVYNAITGHSTRHKAGGFQKSETKSLIEEYNEMRDKEEAVKIGKKESQTVEKAPVFTYCKQMKNAIEALSLRSLYGHKKYEKGDDWDNFSRVENGDFEYSNAQFRHALGIGGEETEKEHLIASAWNAVSRLEIYLRNNK